MAHWSHYNPRYDPRIPPLGLHLPQARPAVQYQNIPYSVSPPMATRYGATHQPDPQSAGGVNTERALTEHLDRLIAGSHQVLLERISRQDAVLSRQQDMLDSVSRLIAAGRNESMKENETIRIQLYDIGKKTDRLTKGISESMKLLATGTIKAITDCQTIIEKRLFCIEESCEGLKEEISDPHANMPEVVHHEVSIRSDSPKRTTPYCIAGTTPPSPPVLSVSLSDLPSKRVLCDVGERDLDSRQQSNNDSPGLSARHGAPSSCEPRADGIDIPEPQSSFERIIYDTVTPMETLRVPSPTRISSSSSHSELDGPLVTEHYEQPSASVPDCHGGTISETLSPTFSSNPSRSHRRPPAATLNLSSPSPPPEATTSSVRVLNATVPSTEDAYEKPLPPTSSSPAPALPDSVAGSACASTISLPEPSALLNELFSQPRNNESQVTGLPSFALQLRPISRAQSLSSLSSLSSVDVPNAINQTLSAPAPAPNNRGGRGGSSKTSTSPRKRRRSSPGPKRGKAAKKPRVKANSGITKKLKKELVDGNYASNGAVSRTKSLAPSAHCSSWSPLVSNTSRQFIQCDKCELWYHWGCVRIRDDDPRLKDDVTFACPPCQDDKMRKATPLPSKKGNGDVCSWPNCDLEEDAAEEFFIEKLIGRYDHKSGGINRFSWLVKWEGYPAEDATWTLGGELTHPAKLIDEFELVAKAEGIVLCRSTMNLLQVAVKAGWANKEV